MAEPLTQTERALKRHEAAIRKLATWLDDEDRKEVEDILDGIETTSEKSADSAE